MIVSASSVSVEINTPPKSKFSEKKLDKKSSEKKLKHNYLNEVDCIAFLLVMQIPINYLISFGQLIIEFGTTLVCITYFFLFFLIGMPLYMMVIVMGQYSRRSFIKYWACISLFKGMGYTISGMILIQEIINTTHVGVSILFLVQILFSSSSWKNCNFSGVTDTCVSMNIQNAKMLTSCSNMSVNEIPTFSTQNYFRFNKLKLHPSLYTSDFGSINVNLAITIALIWISVSFMMMMGFKKLHKTFRIIINLTLFLFLLIFISTLFLSRKYHPGSKLFSDLSILTNMKFALIIFMHVCSRAEPGTALYLTSITDTKLKPTTIALIVCGLKMVLITIMMLWIPFMLQNVMNHYNVKDPSCFTIDGFDILFAVVPDVLSRMPVSRLWLVMWFLVIINLGYVCLVCTCISILDSLIDTHQLLKIYRNHLCLLLSGICCGLNMIISTPLSMMIIKTWYIYGMEILEMVVLTILTFSLIFVYSIVRIATDFHFAYGQPVGKFWIQSWKILPFFILFQAVFTFFNQGESKHKIFHNETIVVSTYLTTLFVLLPIFIVMLCLYSKHVKYQTVSNILQADPDWGYYNVNKRIDRLKFHPQTEVRYKTNRLKCKHRCLVYSKKLKKLQNKSNIRKFLLL